METYEKLTFPSLGSTIDLQIRVNDESLGTQAQLDLEDARKRVEAFEKLLSRFKSESELSRINAAGKYCIASLELLEISCHALKYYQQSNHLFDPRIKEVLETSGYAGDFLSREGDVVINESGNELFQSKLQNDLLIGDLAVCFKKPMDFSGIGKGYIADVIAREFLSKGWKHFVVDCGGDMYCASEKDEFWNVNIEGVSAQQIMVKIQNAAIATSGISKRKWESGGKRAHHLINPFAPNLFKFDTKSVTCIMETVEQADVWAKVLFLMGKEDGLKYADTHNIACVFVQYAGGVHISREAKKYLA